MSAVWAIVNIFYVNFLQLVRNICLQVSFVHLIEFVFLTCLSCQHIHKSSYFALPFYVFSEVVMSMICFICNYNF